MSLSGLATRVDGILTSLFASSVQSISSLLSAASCPSLKLLANRIATEWHVELKLLRTRWKTILLCLVLQYVHGIFTQLVYRLHVPRKQILRDTGFELTPELGPEYFWVSEAIFAGLFGSFLLWSVSPFFFEKKTFYSVVMYKRLLVHLCCCQALRIISFMSTILPGPAHHCRYGQGTAYRAWVNHWWEHLIVDIGRQSSHSCGDLIFSSHTTFILSFVLAYTYYGSQLAPKIAAWVATAVLSILIVCSRKHYTVDVVIAWYVVPLVFLALQRRWTTKRNEQDALKPLEEGLTPETGQVEVEMGGLAYRGPSESDLYAMSDERAPLTVQAANGRRSPIPTTDGRNRDRSSRHSRHPSLRDDLESGHGRTSSEPHFGERRNASYAQLAAQLAAHFTQP